jgi:hypothetical protein
MELPNPNAVDIDAGLAQVCRKLDNRLEELLHRIGRHLKVRTVQQRPSRPDPQQQLPAWPLFFIGCNAADRVDGFVVFLNVAVGPRRIRIDGQRGRHLTDCRGQLIAVGGRWAQGLQAGIPKQKNRYRLGEMSAVLLEKPLDLTPLVRQGLEIIVNVIEQQNNFRRLVRLGIRPAESLKRNRFQWTVVIQQLKVLL